MTKYVSIEVNVCASEVLEQFSTQQLIDELNSRAESPFFNNISSTHVREVLDRTSLALAQANRRDLAAGLDDIRLTIMQG